MWRNTALSIRSITTLSDKLTWFALAFIWICINALALYQFGIVTGFEAEKYITNADYLLQNGHFTAKQFLFYSTQILVIAAAKSTGTFPWLPILIQLVVNATATACFYKVVVQIHQSKKIATLATAALLSMYFYQQYNTHLFTESLYFSCSIIYFYLLIQTGKLNTVRFLVLAGMLSVLYFTRPVGLFYIPATLIYLTQKFHPKNSKFVIAFGATLLVTAFTVLINNTLSSGGGFDFLQPYIEEHIICGVPTINEPHRIAISQEKNSVQGLLYLTIHHYDLVSRLAVKRLVAFAGLLRPYYSLGHNIFLAAYCYSMYLLIILGVKHWKKRDKPLIGFILCNVLLTTISTMLSCDEWHNRFFYSILHLLLLLATFAARPTNDNNTKQNRCTNPADAPGSH